MGEGDEEQECLKASVSGREVIELISQVKLLLPSVETLVKDINGFNGTPGLKADVRMLKQWKEDWEHLKDKWFWPTVVALGIAAIFFIAAVASGRIEILYH